MVSFLLNVTQRPTLRSTVSMIILARGLVLQAHWFARWIYRRCAPYCAIVAALAAGQNSFCTDHHLGCRMSLDSDGYLVSWTGGSESFPWNCRGI